MSVTNEAELNAEINGSDIVLVDFYAQWCGPCKAMAPTLDKIDGEVAKVVKIDIEEAQDLATKYAVRSVPTFVVFKNGEATDQRAGGMTEGQLRSWLGTA
ncbi:thioredoxin [Roseibium sp. RKSG952]|uniref:thioredoxin n=1 Tax=Roseibium sp. RKSG952 TaxID=2529384 RepID=UPI001AD8BF25|nr:thioredoxin [Roseibium sp. RKSG952]